MKAEEPLHLNFIFSLSTPPIRKLWFKWLIRKLNTPIIFKSEKCNHLRNKTYIFTQKQHVLYGGSDALIFFHLMFCSGRGTWNPTSTAGSFLEICMKAKDFIDSYNFVVEKFSLHLLFTTQQKIISSGSRFLSCSDNICPSIAVSLFQWTMAVYSASF